MLSHVSIGVADVAASGRFYDAVFGALGYGRAYEIPEAIGYGREHPEFWVQLPLEGGTPVPSPGTHFCFGAKSQAEVESFHAAGLAGGGTDAGKPGLRPEYTPNYYAAFLLDPDGHKIEAVCFLP
jgi:catechol 2,3-dioxygenase-like lactoylglutathione lyase family enzyme